MSISGALSNALSGLTMASRASELVSSNVANAMTPGYARRELNIGARVLGDQGQGVSVNGVDRVVDRALLSDRRMADAGTGRRATLARFQAGLEGAIGVPGSDASMTARVAALESALIEAASRPDSQARLANVADAATRMTDGFHAISAHLQQARTTADHAIATDISLLNRTLSQVADMNIQIRTATTSGRDTSALMDQRQMLVNKIAEIVPVREITREHDQIALVTSGGAMLLDGRPGEFGFAGVGQITPDMTLGSGALSGLTLNGRPMVLNAPPALLDGGRLAANFAIRDDLATGAQADLDAVARDVVERLAGPTVDTTRAPGDPGLLTDAGGAFDPLNEVGLSQRLTLNALIDPAQGGQLWRLRDGLGAITQGPPGNSALLGRLQGVLTATRQPVSGGFGTGTRSFATLTGDLLSTTTRARLSADAELSFAQAKSDAMTELELQGGVDTDQEMQKLLVIEKTYAANAKVVKTVDELLNLLLGL
jgi:flagellar hook-associated protein 1